ncbi:MAG: hypothetical protein WC492_03205 [Candidatus Micrarchaeia archaeon]
MDTHKSMATKLPIKEYTWILDYCNRKKITPSALIKELLLEEIGPSPSHVAGRNLISYDKKKDSFVWSVELDNGKKAVAAENLSAEFLKDLNHGISDALVSREEMIGRKKKGSVAVPKRLIRGKR